MKRRRFFRDVSGVGLGVVCALVLFLPSAGLSAGSVSGTVTPVTGTAFQVGATPDDPCGAVDWTTTAWTNEVSGAYTLTGLQPGAYYLQITNTAGQDHIQEWWAAPASVNAYDCADAQTVTVTEGQDTAGIDFQLEVGGHIAGTVYQSDGTTPLSNVSIDLVADACTGEGWQPGGTSDANGDYFIRSLPPGAYYLRSNTIGGGQGYLVEWWASGASTPDCSSAQPVATAIGGTYSGIDFQLDLGATISGTVYREGTSTPLANVGINLFAEKCGVPSPGAISLENGTYSIWGLPPGTYYLQTWGDAYESEWWTSGGGTTDCNGAQGITVSSGQTVTAVDFSLAPYASISGTLRDVTGAPLEGVCLTALTETCGGGASFAAITAADGTYRIEGLPAGDYYLVTDAGCGGQGNFADEWYDDIALENCEQAAAVPVAAQQAVTGVDFVLEVGFAMNFSIMSVHKPADQTHAQDYVRTQIEIVPYGYVGTMPDDMTSISVLGPDNTEVFNQDDFTWDPYFNEFALYVDGAPANGVYTATLTAGSAVGTATDKQYINRTIPLPDPGSFRPADGATVASRTPSFSWDPVGNMGIPLYYRLEIRNPGADRVFASGRNFDMTHLTVPDGILSPGATYQWRVRVTDAPDWIEVQNRADSPWQTVTMAGTLAHEALPAIDPNEWDVVTWTTPLDGGGSATNILVSTAVIDHDGVAADGSSHAMWVRFPGQSEWLPLDFQFTRSPVSGYFEGMFNLGGSPPPAGEYTLRAQDLLGGAVIEHTDVIGGSPLEPPVAASVAPNNLADYITATFDNVHVNGSLYDDFDAYGNDIANLDPLKWNGFENAALSGGRLVLDVPAGTALGRGNANLNFADPGAVEAIRADIVVTASPSDPEARARARLYGRFFNEGGYEVSGQINVTRDRVFYRVNRDYANEQATNAWERLGGGELMAAFPGQTIQASITWDPGQETLTFDANGNIAVYTPAGPVFPALSPYKGLQARVDLETAAAPTFTWAGVPSALRNRFRVYGMGGQTLWRGWTGAGTSVAHTVPPGVLRPGAMYRYRLEGFDSHAPLSVDHVSKTPRSNNDNPIFYTASEAPVAPFVALAGAGAFTLNDPDFGPRLEFWVDVYDAQGVPDNIKSVRVRFPSYAQSGNEALLYLDRTAGGSPTHGTYRGQSALTPEAGVYTFVVEDRDGHTVTRTDDFAPGVLPYPESLNAAMDDNAKQIVFDWSDVSGAAVYQFEVFDQHFNRVWALGTPTSTYTLPYGLLKRGALYRYQVKAFDNFFELDFDHMSKSVASGTQMPTLVIDSGPGGAASPSVSIDKLGAMILNTANPLTQATQYLLAFKIRVADPDGVPGDIESVAVTYPESLGQLTLSYEYGLSPTEGVYSGWQPIVTPGDYSGNYVFDVSDYKGNLVSTSDSLTVNILPRPVNVTPAPDTVAYTPTPTVDWDDVDGAAGYQVWLYDGWDTVIHQSPFLTESGYTLPEGLVQLYETYSFRVYAFRENLGVTDADNVSQDSNAPAANHHITFLPAMRGDFYPDGQIDLADTILALQVVAGFAPAGMDVALAVDPQGAIGLQDAIYCLQGAAGMR